MATDHGETPLSVLHRVHCSTLLSSQTSLASTRVTMSVG